MLTMQGSWLFFCFFRDVAYFKNSWLCYEVNGIPIHSIIMRKILCSMSNDKKYFWGGHKSIYTHLFKWIHEVYMYALSKGVSSIWMELCLLELIYIWQKYLVIHHIWCENLCLITKRYSLVVWFALIDATIALARAISFLCATGGIFSLSKIIGVFWSILEWLVPATLEFFWATEICFWLNLNEVI